jgi:hypothetical protein
VNEKETKIIEHIKSAKTILDDYLSTNQYCVGSAYANERIRRAVKHLLYAIAD